MSALAARLGDTLLARGWLDADQLDIAQAEVRAGRPLEQALAQLGFVPDGVLRDTLAELLGLDSLEARALVADSTALAVVPAHWARQLLANPCKSVSLRELRCGACIVGPSACSEWLEPTPRAVAASECNTVTELRPEPHAAWPSAHR